MLVEIKPKCSFRVYLNLGMAIATVFYGSSTIALPLSPGDRLEVSIPKESYFSRVYEVNEDGNLEIPYLGAMYVEGLELTHVEEKLAYALVRQGFFPPNPSNDHSGN